MNYAITTIAALLMAGTALAQAPAKPAKPAQPARAAERAPTADEELALTALEGLMAQSPERALPILKKVLAGPQSKTVKQRALFVLSQIDSPEAREILAQMSRSTDADLRRESIRSIGIGGEPKALESLKQIYTTGSAEVKEEVLQAWMIAGYKDGVYWAALNAKTEDEVSAAIRMLGAMGATDELRKLGDKPNAPRGLLDAYAISGDLASLRKIADTHNDRNVRIEAVSRIGIVDSDEAHAALRDIYTRSTDAEIKQAALQGMLISGDEQGVLSLYRASKSSDEKRELLRTLTMMDGDAALQAIDAALETQSTAAGPATTPPATTLLDKKFEKAAKQYDQKYLHEGQVVYCKRGATRSLPPQECITESALRKQVEDYERSRNHPTRGGPPPVHTVPGG